MGRFLAVFVATVAGLVVLLSFKTVPTKTPPAAALDSATPGSAPAGSAPAVASSAAPAVSSAAVASSAPVATPTASPTPTGATTPTAVATPTPSKTTAKPAPSTPASTTKTVTGASVVVSEGRRQFGVITVQLTLVNGKITKATASEPTTDERSREIASFSIPVLDSEAVSSQSAQINAVSGATITSDAYAQSLQSAIDRAKV
ncbi:MAG TPA: FMN-binding protein [Acidothermaceae bacterium]